MSSNSCTGPTCRFTGPKSGATPGRCTKTAGYISNAEIFEILGAGNGSTHHDTGSDSDIALYGDNWVSFMTPNTTSGRRTKYKGLNFGGTSEWAVDLTTWMLPFDPINIFASNVDWTKAPPKSLCADINRDPTTVIPALGGTTPVATRPGKMPSSTGTACQRRIRRCMVSRQK
ncbi:hypothetical protein THARTR1_05874 [Trichoderma harzianum]|uniref:Uncharacterized protein n=1 Tax=Trichoderma harzianum TaxID=5544 RepID=A0A2K0U7J3_TRIHA|nr:hypothetical protein THARTR1_05874 [Trichoderma harzianum]